VTTSGLLLLMRQWSQCNTGRTKLRTDLIFSQQKTGGENAVIVKDPVMRKFFRFREAEHFIAQQLDGSTPGEVIRQRVEERFGTALTPETLEEFIDKLRRRGLLEEEAKVGSDAHRRGRVRGSLFYLRLKAFDPDWLLNHLIARSHFFFTPHFLMFSGAVILLGCGLTIVNWREIEKDILQLYRVETLLFGWLTILFVALAHEFAHGLTCKHFGGEVHEIGFLLLYFQPAFYCNVSEAWLFPEKSKRLWVTFAGPYFELFLAALATLIWRVTDPATWLNAAALVVMAVSGIRTFLNLIPLIKLDGYYFLSDYLDIPNLRQRAFRYLGSLIKQKRGSAGNTSEQDLVASPRERRIYLCYGVLAAAFTITLLAYLGVRFSAFLIDHYQASGFIFFLAVFIPVLRNRLRRLLPALRALVAKGSLAIMTSPKRGAKVLTIFAVILAVLFLGRMELRVAGEFRILPMKNTDVRAEVEGIIAEIHVNEGDQVREGDLIARLFDRDYRAELNKIEAEVSRTTAKLKMLKTGPREEEIALARAQVETAKTKRQEARRRYEEAKLMLDQRLAKAKAAVGKATTRLEYKRNDLDRFKAMLDAGFISRREFDIAEEEKAVREQEVEEAEAELKMVLADDLAEVRNRLAIAEKELDETKGRLTVLLAGSRQEEIEGAEAELARLTAQQVYLEEQLRLLTVRSPHAGMVTTPALELKQMIGKHVMKGDLIAEVHELKTTTVEIMISEQDIGDVQIGQSVVLKARAYPLDSLVGKVTSIATTAAAAAPEKEEIREGKTVLVTTQVDNSSLLLKPEMSGYAKVFCGERSIFELITRRIARYIRIEFWSWW